MKRTTHKLLSGVLTAALLLQTVMPSVAFAAEGAPKTMIGISSLEQTEYTLPIGAEQAATDELLATFPKTITAEVEYVVTEEVTPSPAPPVQDSGKPETLPEQPAQPPVTEETPAPEQPTVTDEISAEDETLAPDENLEGDVSGNTTEKPRIASDSNLPAKDEEPTVSEDDKSEPTLVEKKVTEKVELSVTWGSEQKLTTKEAGAFTYTATLSDAGKGKYALASGVSLPEITVTVGAPLGMLSTIGPDNAVASQTNGSAITYYDNLLNALNATAAGETSSVKLLQDVQLDTVPLSVGGMNSRFTVTLDLNGKTVTSNAKNTFYINNGINFTLEDTSSGGGGAVKNTYSGFEGEQGEAAAIYNTGTFTMKGGVVDARDGYYGITNVNIKGFTGASLTIEGGVIVKGKKAAIWNVTTTPATITKALILGTCVDVGDMSASWSCIGDMALPVDASIPAGKTLAIRDGGSLTVKNGVTLTLDGGTISAGSASRLVNQGTLISTTFNTAAIQGVEDRVYTGSPISFTPTVAQMVLGNAFAVDTAGYVQSWHQQGADGTWAAINASDIKEVGKYKLVYTEDSATPNVVEKLFNILPSGTEYTGSVKAYRADGMETTTFAYGDTITFQVIPTSVPASKGRALTPPTNGELALFAGDTQITAPQTNTSGSTLQFTYDTTGTNAIHPNELTEITAKYVSGGSRPTAMGSVALTVTAEAELTKSGAAGYWSTVQTAIDRLPSGETGTVKLMKDVDLGDKKGLSVPSANSSCILTLDLNGKTITSQSSETLRVAKNNTITIQDSGSGGTLTNAKNGGRGISNIGGILTMNSGTVSVTGASGNRYCVYNTEGGRFTMSGGVLDARAGTAGILNFNFADNPSLNGGDITINGGVILAGSTAGTYAIQNDSTTAKLTVTNRLLLGDCTGTGTGGLGWSSVGSMTLPVNAEIPSGKIFTVPAGSTLTVGQGATLTNNGTINVYGTLNHGAPTYGTLAGNAPIIPGSGSNSGGSGSSGGGGNDAPSIFPQKTNKANRPTTTKNNITSKTNHGKATATVPDKFVSDAIDKAQKEAQKNGTKKNGLAIIFNVKTDKNASALEITLSAASMDALIQAGVTRLTLKNSLATMTLDLAALKALDSGKVKLSVSRVDVKTLSANAQKAIGNRPVFQCGATVGGKAVTDFKGGRVGLQMPYALAGNETAGNLVGVYVDANGKVTWLENSSFDPLTGTLLASTTHFSVFGVGYKVVPSKFTDVGTHWAKNEIDFVVARELLSGTSATTFAPDTGITRGMFVAALGRLAGVDTKKYSSTQFTDVKADAYYAPYVAWANANSIVNGITDTTFSPDTAITREQMAVMLVNYSKTIGYKLPSVHAEVSFVDAGSIGAGAKDAVKQIQMAGILMGKSGNRFDPTAAATRAEVSAMLCRYVELMVSTETAEGWAMNESGQWLYIENGKRVTGKTILPQNGMRKILR